MCSAIEDAERWRDDPLVKLLLSMLGDRAFARAVILPIFTPLGQWYRLWPNILGRRI